MSRYDDRDYDREEQDYGRGRGSEYGRSYRGRPQERYRYDDSDRQSERYGRVGRSGDEYNERYSSGQERERGRYSRQGRENDFGESSGRYYGRESGYGDYGDRFSSGGQSGSSQYGGRFSTSRDREPGDYSRGRSSSGRGMYGGEGYAGDRSENDWRYSSGRERSYDNYDRYGEGRYGQGNYSQRYDYPGSGTRESYPDRSWTDYDRGEYGREQQRGYESEHGESRGWWDRTADEVASWFGDKEAERRRQMDQQRQLRGRGPKGYRRSDERIKEDVNDRLSDGYLDASDIEVSVMESEVTLTGTVNTREDKRVAEYIAEGVSGVTNVENRLRVKQSSLDRPFIGSSEPTEKPGAVGTGSSTGMRTSGTTPTSGTTGTGTSGTSATGTGESSTSTTGRGKGAGS